MALNLLAQGVGMNAFVGVYTDDASATTAVKSESLDTNGNGSGNPLAGMTYYNTTSQVWRMWDGSSWNGLDSASQVRTSVGSFNGVLSGSDTTVQLALDTLDDHGHTSSAISDFTEAAQDAVGGALTDSGTIDFTYDDGANTITAIVKPLSITATELANNIDASTKNFNAASVNGASLNDAGTGLTDLWSAQQIISSINGAITGIDWKESVRVATDANANWTTSATLTYSAPTLTISGLSAGAARGLIDGTELSDGDRVLIKDAGAASAGAAANDLYNGIWVVTGGTTTSLTLTRATDLTDADLAAGAATTVEEGTTNADQIWICTSNQGSDVVGTNPITWSTFGGTTSHNALTGLQGGVAGQYYHLTSTQHSALTGGGNASAQHIHDDRYFTETELGSTTASTEGASLIGTDSKTNIGAGTTVEAALEYINTNWPTLALRPQTGTAGNPNGTVTPRYTGDFYVQTTGANLMWMSYGTANTNWKII